MNNDELCSDSDVFSKFALWLNQARSSYQDNNLDNYNAFTLSTTNNEYTSSRTILLKAFSVKGFVFFTNYKSKKSLDISINKNVSMLFYWPTLGRQIRIDGSATKVNSIESDKYFFSRPYDSQIGAWASEQSQTLVSYQYLMEKFAEYKKLFASQAITRPSHWGGFNVEPYVVEFWHDKPSRLHLREVYKKIPDDNHWQKILLNP